MPEENTQPNEAVGLEDKTKILSSKKQESLFGKHYKKWAKYSLYGTLVATIIFVIVWLMDVFTISTFFDVTSEQIISLVTEGFIHVIGFIIIVYLIFGAILGLIYALIRCIVHKVVIKIQDKQSDKQHKIPIYGLIKHCKKWAKYSFWVTVILPLIYVIYNVYACYIQGGTLDILRYSEYVVLYAIFLLIFLYLLFGIGLGLLYGIIRCLVDYKKHVLEDEK